MNTQGNRPPPQGWNQPPRQPPRQQPNQPPQQWNQPPPGRRPPPPKNRAGLVVGVAAGVVALALVITLGVMYVDYAEEPGGEPGATPVAQCEISQGVREAAHVSSFRLATAPDESSTWLKHTLCQWDQTKGQDGRDTRALLFHVNDYQDVEDAETKFKETGTNGDRIKPVDGVGDEASYRSPQFQPDLGVVDMVVRKGGTVWSISYTGHDKGFFFDSAFPVEEGEAVVRRIAEELVGR